MPRQLLRVAALLGGADQFLDEERVAVGAVDDAAQVGFVDRPPAEGADQLTNVVRGERVQAHPGDGGQP